LPDTLFRTDFQDEILQRLLGDILEEKFDPYYTSVGGSGLGILSPYPEHRAPRANAQGQSGPVTPPETPFLGTSGAHDQLRPAFEKQPTLDLSQWAESLGRWLYV
jgi:hypothetical protein